MTIPSPQSWSNKLEKYENCAVVLLIGVSVEKSRMPRGWLVGSDQEGHGSDAEGATEKVSISRKRCASY